MQVAKATAGQAAGHLQSHALTGTLQLVAHQHRNRVRCAPVIKCIGRHSIGCAGAHQPAGKLIQVGLAHEHATCSQALLGCRARLTVGGLPCPQTRRLQTEHAMGSDGVGWGQWWPARPANWPAVRRHVLQCAASSWACGRRPAACAAAQRCALWQAPGSMRCSTALCPHSPASSSACTVGACASGV